MFEARFDGLPRRSLAGELTLVWAGTYRSRLRGLGGLASLPATQALAMPARSIHTATVRFPLDLIWIAKDGSVLRHDRDVPRWRVRTCLRAAAVIETAAGAGDAFVAAGAATAALELA